MSESLVAGDGERVDLRELAEFVAEFIREDCDLASEVSSVTVLDAMACFGLAGASRAYFRALGVQS